MSSLAASPRRSLGLLYCLAFVSLEAVQAVYFGGVFQRIDSFLLGSAIFGLACACSLLWTVCRDRGQFAFARREWRNLVKVGIGTAVSWMAYFLALQLVEPAVAYTVFSGLVPLTILAAARFGVPEASPAAGRGSRLGHLLIAASVVYLCLASIAGLTGFESGGLLGGIGGVIALLATGLSSTWVIFYCRRLDGAGLTATALFGLRYLPYVVLAAVAAAMGIDAKPPVPVWHVSQALVIGLALVATPSYLVQRAIPLVSPLLIGLAGALGPFLVFGLQAIEGRIAYSSWTLVGLVVYCLGTALAATSEALPGKPVPGVSTGI
jgi:drug/metabolite transporter (DMT)-like permease